jgi:homoserine dehydrogenase
VMTTPLRIGICGLGTVGQAVVRLLREEGETLARRAPRPLEITALGMRSPKAGFDPGTIPVHRDVLAVARDPAVDVVVELMGGTEDAKTLVELALAEGKAVVTANKALLSEYGDALFAAATAKGLPLAFEAAVAGGIPIIKALREGLAGNRIEWLAGIINGTSNFILTEMASAGRAFEDVLKEAQALGYAEADPTFDVEGIDAAHKLTILAAIAFGQQPDFNAVSIQGIRDVSSVDFAYANQLGFRIKLVGVAEPGLMPRMQTCMLPLDSQLAKVNGVLNAVEFHGAPVGSVLAVGPGAGGGATSSAVLSDLIDIAAGRGGLAFGKPVDQLTDASGVRNGTGPDKAFYVRLMVVDQPGVLATVTAILQKHDISVEGLLQQGRAPGDVVALVMTTHETPVASMTRALDEMEQLPIVNAKPVAMPILPADMES